MIFAAEIGMNHDGSWDRAYELIRQAKHCGADIAKFQFGWRSKPGEINHISPELAMQLKDWCDYWEIEFMASIIAPDALGLALSLGVNRFKIASRTVKEYPDLVREILDLGKETYVSLGWWDGSDLPFGTPSDQLRYLYCVSKYPTYPKDIIGMPASFGSDGIYGYSDHMHGIEACLLAISRGALFIEKHFTLDKTILSIHNDHILSANPREFTTMVDLGRPLSRLQQVCLGVKKGVAGVPK